MSYGYESRDGHMSSVAEHPANVPRKLAAIVESLQHSACDLKHTARHGAHDVVSSVKAAGAEARLAAWQGLAGVERSIGKRISNEPTRALLAATGIGFVLGVLFVRREHRR